MERIQKVGRHVLTEIYVTFVGGSAGKIELQGSTDNCMNMIYWGRNQRIHQMMDKFTH